MKDEILVNLFIGGIILAGILVIGAILSFGFSIGDNYYTGYIYSAETAWGRTIGELRFSQDAGEDHQPSFCVYGEQAEKAKELAGSGIKVRVHEKPTGLHFKGLFGCFADTEIEILEGANEAQK